MLRVFVFGGIAQSLITFRGALLKEMIALGHEVFVCAPNASKEVREKLAEMGVIYEDININRTGLNPIQDIRSILNLIRVVRRIRPNLFLGYTIKPVIYGSIAAKLCGVDRIYSMITGLGYVFSNSSVKSKISCIIAKLLYSFALNYNRVVFFQNPDDMQLFTDKGIIKDNRKATLINGSGVDLDRYYPAPFPNSLSFLLIARLIRDKGITEYFDAASILKKRHPQVKFKLVGFIDKNPTAISEEELQAWVESGVIEFLGRLRDVRPAIAESSVYVLPSYYPEGTPHSVLEAMAMRRPIITTDKPGCRETVISGQNGILVSAKDVPSLVSAMEHFIEHADQIEYMGEASRKFAVDKYDVHKVNAVILKAMELH